MKKTGVTRIILIFILLISQLSTACQNTENTIPESTDTNTAETTAQTVDLYIPDLPERSFGGVDFTFIGTDGSKFSGYYTTDDIYVESSVGEVFNDAIFERNQKIEEEYDINIKYIASSDVSSDIMKSVNASDYYYDALFEHQQNLYILASQGYLMDLNQIEYLGLENVWWDQNCISDFNILGKNYFITGDISTLDDSSTRLCLFNKQLISDYQLETPYELIENNDWTIDSLKEMILSVSHDVDGNGIMEPGDVSGIISELALFNILYYGCGGSYIEAEDNIYKVSADSEANYQRMEKILDIMLDTSLIPMIENWANDYAGFSNGYTYARSLFTQDKFLFHFTGPLTFNEFRDMESDFGIVPPPKYDKEQERYYCYVDPQAPMLAVSSGTPDIDKVGIILEAMAAQSKNIVTPAFHETLLKRKHVRDNESAVMLDIIDKSRLYTVELVTGWGGIGDIAPNKARTNQRALISDFAAVKAQTEAQIESAMELFASLE